MVFVFLAGKFVTDILDSCKLTEMTTKKIKKSRRSWRLRLLEGIIMQKIENFVILVAHLSAICISQIYINLQRYTFNNYFILWSCSVQIVNFPTIFDSSFWRWKAPFPPKKNKRNSWFLLLYYFLVCIFSGSKIFFLNYRRTEVDGFF